MYFLLLLLQGQNLLWNSFSILYLVGPEDEKFLPDADIHVMPVFYKCLCIPCPGALPVGQGEGRGHGASCGWRGQPGRTGDPGQHHRPAMFIKWFYFSLGVS